MVRIIRQVFRTIKGYIQTLKSRVIKFFRTDSSITQVYKQEEIQEIESDEDVYEPSEGFCALVEEIKRREFEEALIKEKHKGDQVYNTECICHNYDECWSCTITRENERRELEEALAREKYWSCAIARETLTALARGKYNRVITESTVEC
jgi:hypothetical protein